MENSNSNIEKPRRTRTMSEAALAANRENAKKSTGPRTTAGKARSASNNFRHGLYQMDLYGCFNTSHDHNLASAHNFLEQLAPVTPIEHSYAHAIITLQLRYLQMETLYSGLMEAVSRGENPKHFAAVLRELNLMPSRLEKLLKAYRAEVALRQTQEIEPIVDLPTLPNPRIDPNENSDSNPNPPYNQTSTFIHQFLSLLSLSQKDDPIHLQAFEQTLKKELKNLRQGKDEANGTPENDPGCGNLHDEL